MLLFRTRPGRSDEAYRLAQHVYGPLVERAIADLIALLEGVVCVRNVTLSEARSIFETADRTIGSCPEGDVGHISFMTRNSDANARGTALFLPGVAESLLGEPAPRELGHDLFREVRRSVEDRLCRVRVVSPWLSPFASLFAKRRGILAMTNFREIYIYPGARRTPGHLLFALFHELSHFLVQGSTLTALVARRKISRRAVITSRSGSLQRRLAQELSPAGRWSFEVEAHLVGATVLQAILGGRGFATGPVMAPALVLGGVLPEHLKRHRAAIAAWSLEVLARAAIRTETDGRLSALVVGNGG